MKIAVTDKNGTGIVSQFAEAIGAKTKGRYTYIPKNKGEGYITGFPFADDFRVMIRNYYLKEEIVLERTNDYPEGSDYVVFFLGGIFGVPQDKQHPVSPEQPTLFITMHAISSVMSMPSNTSFRSITIITSRQFLKRLFGDIQHPVVESILKENNNFALEAGISPEMIKTAGEIVHQVVPESIELYYYRLKCEELLCYIFTLLMQREATPMSNMHIDDIKAIYAIKLHLQSHLDEPPNIASLAAEAGMSEPKMRKLFKQMFGKGVFEYYQSMRMQEAARLLKEKRLTVSEVGYDLGFTNLSHFSREFEAHIGMKPKKYSAL